MIPVAAITASDLLEWQNLFFAIPLALTVLLGLVTAFGLIGSGEGDAHGDHDADGDHDSGDGHDHDHAHGDHDHETGIASLLGIGRAPLTVVLISLFGLFGLTGLVMHETLAGLLGPGLLAFGGAFASAAIISIAGTRAIAGTIGRVLPRDESYVVGSDDLAGLVGTAETNISETFGIAVVKDKGGTLHQLRCQAAPGATIARGAPVLVVEYDHARQIYHVRPPPPELQGDKR